MTDVGPVGTLIWTYLDQHLGLWISRADFGALARVQSVALQLPSLWRDQERLKNILLRDQDEMNIPSIPEMPLSRSHQFRCQLGASLRALG